MKFRSLLLLPFALSGLALAEDGVPKAFVAYDSDKDGSVTYIEFAKVKKSEFDALDRDRSKSLTLQEAEKAPSVEADDFFALPSFDEIDADKDETLTLSEYGTSVQKVFQYLDAIEGGQEDKIVTLTEYVAAVKIQQAKAAAAGPGAAATAARKGSQKAN